jgi:hypothetical protein
MVLMSTLPKGADDGSFESTIHTVTDKMGAIYDVADPDDCPSCKENVQVPSSIYGNEMFAPLKESTIHIHWDPEYPDAELDEFFAFCFDGFLVDWSWPEEEIRFDDSRKKTTPKDKAEPNIEETIGKTGEKKKHKLKCKNGKKKGKENMKVGTDPKEGETNKRKAKKPTKKKTTRKDSTSSENSTKKKRKQSKQEEAMVDMTPQTIRKTSSNTESSSDVSFFEEEGDDTCSFQDDFQDDDPTLKQDDEEAKLVRLRLEMTQAAADAASLGRLTRLSEKVVESVSLEQVIEPVDTWKVKKSAAETELNRSNHFQVINEAAALGQMKRVRNKSAAMTTSLRGWAESEDEEKQEQPLDWRQCSSTNFSCQGRPLRQTRRSKVFLSSHERMDRFVEDAVAEKKKSMYAPDQVLERQQQKDEVLSRFLSGDMDWLPSTNLPTIALPKVFLSKKRIRDSLVAEVAQACAVRNHRLSCNFHLNIRKACQCPYCKAPSAIQTLAYQVLQKEHGKEASGMPKRFNSAPRVLTSTKRTTAVVDPTTLYSRTTLRRAKTEPCAPESSQISRHVPSWAHATLKRAERVENTKEGVLTNVPPIWALATGTRDDDLPEWASPALRDLVKP